MYVREKTLHTFYIHFTFTCVLMFLIMVIYMRKLSNKLLVIFKGE